MDHEQDLSVLANASPESGNVHVQEVLRQAHKELGRLMQQRAEMRKRIGTIRQTIVGLANLFGESVLSNESLELVGRESHGRQPGFTDACRTILMENGCAMSARDVVQQIRQRMPTILARHNDPTASVTTVLNRLVNYGEARVVILDNARRGWQWGSGLCTRSLSQNGSAKTDSST
jgi:hypothetical protein